MDRYFKFSDFTNIKKYCQLQERFCLMDERGVYEKITEPLENKTITFLKIDFEGEDYKELKLNEDYLPLGISEMSQFYLRRFLNIIKNKVLLNEQKSELAKTYMSNIVKAHEIISKAEYLNSDIKEALKVQLDNLEIELIEYLENPYPEIKTKIQFNWSRTDIIYFFHLLKENNQIEEIRDAHLGRIIDSIVECRSGDDYLSIEGSRKHLNDFRNTSGRSETHAIERLKSRLSGDFFNV